MSKEFVLYEEALALKELGFNEPCIYYFITKNFSEPIGTNGRVSLTATNKDTFDKMLCTAPLYQQVFRWFREKHKLFAPVTTNGLGQYDFRIGLEWSGRIWDTYEEAELVCLKKLIEIVKAKK